MSGAVKGVGKGTVGAVNKLGKGSVGAVKGLGKGTLGAVKGVGKGTLGAVKGVGKGTVGTVKGTMKATLAAGKMTVDAGKATMNAGKHVIPKGLTKRKIQRHNSRLAWDSRLTAACVKLDLVIECKNLPKKNSFAAADAFCGVWEVPPSFGTDNKRVTRLPAKQEKELGRTEVMRAARSPQFTTTFRLEYKFQEEQTYIIRVYDEDLRYATDLAEHDFIGGVFFTLGELTGTPGCVLARPLQKGKAFIVLSGKEIVETSEVLQFRFSGQELGEVVKRHSKIKELIGGKEVLMALQQVDKKLDLINLAKQLDKFNPFFRLERFNKEDQSWTVVWKSEVIKDDMNPIWDVARLPLQLLCDDDPDNLFKISVWTYNKHQPDEYVGFVETKIAMLVTKAQRGIPVFPVMKERRKLFGGTKLKKAGALKILKSVVEVVPSMLEFFTGGCKMNLMFAIDCTEANKDWRADEQSLHYHGATWLNDYQAAIKKLGTLFDSYTGNEYLMWGYGAKLRGAYTPHFLISGELPDTDSLLEEYNNFFSDENGYAELHPTAELGPVVQAAMYNAIQASMRTQCYSTLVILSTGEISDMQQTVDGICAAAEDAPLSIVIIGVGGGNLDKLKLLGGSEGSRLRNGNGVPLARDIIHFVDFAKFHGHASRCVAESLKEIPEQLVQHYMNSGVSPQPPPEIPDFTRKSLHHSQPKRHGSLSSLGHPLLQKKAPQDVSMLNDDPRAMRQKLLRSNARLQ
jgi:hypothetical protein